ncbi:GGDEF domain-containing protein [Aeromicrobium wangtongii]|uniref:GGDEF domain-containing protein n=1 Tax=Aeromicrobium wangtongii TaxID=2969247 RepID=A0ABY5M778_9ACTN|nr:GGDEF domain-containing protein [Aeromicrobium wangtongii]MCD9199667.1 GGDEF domain-containing protein [Aeromicrobium wangtongii]UUP14018.1 GGDEF domain-containing protein [Aeromicrobium wangtongii]
MLLDRFASSAARSTAFARVTSLAAGVIAATGVLDLITGSANLSPAWTFLVTGIALVIAALPWLLRSRFHPAAGLVGCWLFIVVTALQIHQGGDQVQTVNNLVLYPMIGCYLGWFFRPAIARWTTAGLFAFSAAALVTTEHRELFTTWSNLALGSFFCLEAALFLRAELDRQIRSDPLTGAFNRIGLSSQLNRELSRAARAGTPLTVAAIDLDGFKAINDRFGHPAGDRTLVDLVARLHQSLRPSDVIARIGGDEFVILLPETSPTAAATIMERLRGKSITAWTWGLATAEPSDTQETLLGRADRDLYERKRRRLLAPD